MVNEQPPAYPWSPLDTRPSCCHPNPILRTRNLTLSYGKTIAFENINFSLYQGCLTALVGPSGCGKTSFLTTMNRLCELVPQAKLQGDVILSDKNIFSPNYDVTTLRKKVGMIFQKPNPFPFSIKKNITLPLKEHGTHDKEALEYQTQNALERVGLWHEVKDRLNAPALNLSGGQQQRLCIARALALAPEILLMDEPCSALDPISSGVVEDLIDELRGNYTILIVTHNLAQARRMADYLGVFWVRDQKGCLIEFGTGKQLFESPKDPITASYLSGLRG